MWGQDTVFATRVIFHRIIPTRVGTSLWCNPCTSRLQDHPHACGDKNPSTGKFIVSDRIIPTRVGTSYNSVRCNSCHRDHPHACGDKLLRLVTEDHIIGSSPRVWGQVFGVIPVLLVYRIIPTRVGTRVLQNLLSLQRKDHPHACGDKQYIYAQN